MPAIYRRDNIDKYLGYKLNYSTVFGICAKWFWIPRITLYLGAIYEYELIKSHSELPKMNKLEN